MCDTHNLELSDAQKRKLLRGQSVQVRPECIGKGHAVQVSAAISKNIARAMKLGKGVRVSLDDISKTANSTNDAFSHLLTKAQRLHLGGSAASDWKKLARSANKTFSKANTKPLVDGLKMIAPTVAGSLVGALGSAVGSPILGAVAGAAVSEGVSQGIKKSGRGRPRKVVQGAGLESLAPALAPIAQKIGEDLATHFAKRGLNKLFKKAVPKKHRKKVAQFTNTAVDYAKDSNGDMDTLSNKMTADAQRAANKIEKKVDRYSDKLVDQAVKKAEAISTQQQQQQQSYFGMGHSRIGVSRSGNLKLVGRGFLPSGY